MKRKNLILTLLGCGVAAITIPAIVVPTITTTQNTINNVNDNNGNNDQNNNGNGNNTNNGDQNNNNQNNGNNDNTNNDNQNNGNNNGTNNGDQTTDGDETNLSPREKTIKKLVNDINNSSKEAKRNIGASLLSSQFKLKDDMNQSQLSTANILLNNTQSKLELLSYATAPAIDAVNYDSINDTLTFTFDKSFDYSNKYCVMSIGEGSVSSYTYYILNNSDMKIVLSLNHLDVRFANDKTYTTALNMLESQSSEGITFGYIVKNNKKTIGLTSWYRNSDNYLTASKGVYISYFINVGYIASGSSDNLPAYGKKFETVNIDNINENIDFTVVTE